MKVKDNKYLGMADLKITTDSEVVEGFLERNREGQAISLFLLIYVPSTSEIGVIRVSNNLDLFHYGYKLSLGGPFILAKGIYFNNLTYSLYFAGHSS